jgi:hypothetical protein
MHKVKIMDVDQEHQIIDKDLKHQKNMKKSEKIIKINDSLFEIGLRKGLIEKNEDGYYFIGDYEELLAFKTKKLFKSFEWSD